MLYRRWAAAERAGEADILARRGNRFERAGATCHHRERSRHVGELAGLWDVIEGGDMLGGDLLPGEVR